MKQRRNKSEKKVRPTYPFVIERRIKGYHVAIVIFICFGLLAWFFTRSLLSVGLGLFLAFAMWILSYLQRRALDRNGFDVWRFQVMELTRLTPLNRKPTGFFADALDGPYRGKTCHISLADNMVTPSVGQKIELFVPGNLEASPIRNVFYIPQHYGFEFLSDVELQADE